MHILQKTMITLIMSPCSQCLTQFTTCSVGGGYRESSRINIYAPQSGDISLGKLIYCLIIVEMIYY